MELLAKPWLWFKHSSKFFIAFLLELLTERGEKGEKSVIITTRGSTISNRPEILKHIFSPNNGYQFNFVEVTGHPRGVRLCFVERCICIYSKFEDRLFDKDLINILNIIIQ